MNDASATGEPVPMSMANERAPLSAFGFNIEIVESETHGPLCARLLAGEKFPCFLGLSPESSSLNRGRLGSILEWLVPRVSRLTVAEGSFLTRWNLRAIEQLPEVEAERIGEERQEAAVRRITKTLREVSGAERVEVMNWASVVRSFGFSGIRSGVESFAARDSAFEGAVLGAVGEFMRRKRGRDVCVDPTAAQMALLRSYVVEEIAMFVHLYEAGLRTEVYPGDDLYLMRELAAGRFASFPFDLSGRTHIGIRLRPV